ncbi:prepilin-type N-terminal cleavage/methylation domain-containing protein [Rossellomorea aquimaris]|uniref:competence type IV pilus minor pilin ComGD n=1 Tax=Rossellomorea aquimaris TaxID=189382 RepID=UPI001CD765ED|nr:competence type IV pilus minor pilin ComGD [Rossellomorea aquimaris]MCA1054809.1 prepilin-type N-terminal cleavage/methylation domain-containing protein [Rossellomorea aquimaris]
MLQSKGISHQGGYTFIEMLLVLLIVTVLLSFTAFSTAPLKAHTEKNHFISQLQSDLYLIQSQSFFSQSSTTLLFYPYANKYVAKDYFGNTLVSRTLPHGIHISENNNLDEIIFNPSGNTNRFGSVYFSNGDTTIKLSFQIGQGRFYVQEF